MYFVYKNPVHHSVSINQFYFILWYNENTEKEK
ncbi:hypothetical protein JOD44_002844 [Salimicrobium jeotgali]|nr:hypothetical protein [Salimicrobium jeotgali]